MIMNDPMSCEKDVLEDVKERTGLSFRRLGGIDSQDIHTASLVLPVLAEWVTRTSEPVIRQTIYSTFHTPWARPYFDSLLTWWRNESDELAREILIQAISSILPCEHAQNVWKLAKQLPRSSFHYLLLSKIANCPTTKLDAAHALMDDLRAGAVPSKDYGFIAKVKDPAIQSWFADQQDSSDPSLRRIARRLSAKLYSGSSLPTYAERSPDRQREVFSTEVGLEDIIKTLIRLERDFGVKSMSSDGIQQFLETADINRWARIRISLGNLPGALWLRLEDEDVVELVLISEGAEEKKGNAKHFPIV